MEPRLAEYQMTRAEAVSVWQRLRDAGLDWRGLAIVGGLLVLIFGV